METLFEILILSLLLMNFRLLMTNRIAVGLEMLVLQALVINILPLLSFLAQTFDVLALVSCATMVKAGLLPWLIWHAMLRTGTTRETQSFVGYTNSVLIGLVLLGLSWLAANSLTLPTAAPVDALLISTALFTMLTGAFLLCARRTALMQVIGFLVLENGVYIFGVVFAIQEPWLVQAGVLLDLLAAVFIMGIMIYHINREFAHIDTGKLSALKD